MKRQYSQHLYSGPRNIKRSRTAMRRHYGVESRHSAWRDPKTTENALSEQPDQETISRSLSPTVSTDETLNNSTSNENEVIEIQADKNADDVRMAARRRGKDITRLCYLNRRASKKAPTGHGDSIDCSKSTGPTVGPDGTSSCDLAKAPGAEGLADHVVPELLPCNDFRNQEKTSSPNTIEPLEHRCRCCLEKVIFKREQFGNTSGALTDTYTDMLLTTFGISVTQVPVHLVNTLALICNKCKICLQNAFAYKQQILDADKRFVEYIESGLFNDLEKNNGPDVTNQSSVLVENNYGSDQPINDYNNTDIVQDSAASKKVPMSDPKARKQKNKETGINCEICHKMEDNCFMMAYHLKRYHHQCNKCSKMLRNNYERIDHEQAHPMPCNVCKEECETDLLLRSHMFQEHNTLQFHTCLNCKTICESREKLNEHRVEAHGAPKLQCGACYRIFYEKSQLTKHHRFQHMLERNFPCTKCDYKAPTSHTLKRHIVAHSNVKPFQCQHCQKRFARPGTLLFHERIHTGEKRQVCKQCGAAFVQRASLKYHLEKQHPGQF